MHKSFPAVFTGVNGDRWVAFDELSRMTDEYPEVLWQAILECDGNLVVADAQGFARTPPNDPDGIECLYIPVHIARVILKQYEQ